jgi:hypothetical protein
MNVTLGVELTDAEHVDQTHPSASLNSFTMVKKSKLKKTQQRAAADALVNGCVGLICMFDWLHVSPEWKRDPAPRMARRRLGQVCPSRCHHWHHLLRKKKALPLPINSRRRAMSLSKRINLERQSSCTRRLSVRAHIESPGRLSRRAPRYQHLGTSLLH